MTLTLEPETGRTPPKVWRLMADGTRRGTIWIDPIGQYCWALYPTDNIGPAESGVCEDHQSAEILIRAAHEQHYGGEDG